MDWDDYDRDDFLNDLDINVETLEDNPAIQNQIGHLRDEETGRYEFEDRMTGLSGLMGYRVAEDMPAVEETVDSPLEKVRTQELDDVVVLPVLRAGLAMRDGLVNAWKDVGTGFIDAWRDKDLNVEIEYAKLPDLDAKTVVITDPMVATGNTLAAVHDAIEKGYDPERYIIMSAISVPEGLDQVDAAYPDDTEVYTAAIDDEIYEDDFKSPGLNEHGYIVPGLGDAGDRLYGEPETIG